MTNRVLFLLLLCCHGVSMAGGVISPRLDIGFSGDYHSEALQVTLWHDEQGWYGGLGYSNISSGDEISNDANVNLGYQFHNQLDINIQHYINRGLIIENEVSDISITLPLSLAVPQFNNTSLLLSVGKTTYTVQTNVKRKLHRNDYSLGFTHRMTPLLDVGLSHSWHHTKESLTVVKRRLQRELIRNEAILSTLLGLHDNAWSTWASYEITERSQISTSFTRADNLFVRSTDSIAVDHTYQLTNDIGLGTSINYINDGQSADWYGSLSLNIFF